MDGAWPALARGAQAADAMLSLIAPERVRKAASPLSTAGFEDLVRALALRLFDEVEQPEAKAVKDLRAALDVNWPKASAQDRERALRQAEAIIGRLGSTVAPPLRKVLRDRGKAIVDATKNAAVGRWELPVAAVFGEQDSRIVEHAANSQALYVTTYYGNRATVVSQRARDLVSKRVGEGLDQYEIGKELEALVGHQLGRSKSYFALVASIFAARSRTWSVLSTFEEAEIEHWQFSAVLDEATCFAAGTRVLLGDGVTYAPIDKLRAGDIVMSCKGRPRPVVATLRQPVRKWGELILSDPMVGPLVLTRTHGMLTSRGWMRAQALTTDDRLALWTPSGQQATSLLWGDERAWGMRRGRHDARTLGVPPWPHAALERGGRFTQIRSLTWTETGRTEDAYDIEVEEDSGYVAEGLIVHNSHICRFLDGQVFSVSASAQRFRDVAASEDPEAVKELQPFVREKRDEDGRSVLYVGDWKDRFEIARVETSAKGKKDDRGTFSGGASAQELEGHGVSAPPLHGHCRSELIPA